LTFFFGCDIIFIEIERRDDMFSNEVWILLENTYSDFSMCGSNMLGDLYIEFSDNGYVVISYKAMDEIERFWQYHAMNINAEHLWKVRLLQLVDSAKRTYEQED
jgi:hypothetical protein